MKSKGKEGLLVHWSLLCGYQGFGLSLMQVNQENILSLSTLLHEPGKHGLSKNVSTREKK